ncbi:ankyrin repeat-containing domain protein [Aspergillus leporis]|uniref:Ankyrin repeat-containing domain protein n=1 Tax=Aspergillus leporis TaxID=41062 RepID=A0A5N5XF24_9EURO|nr:ankyrin repeat-containing domain protein [Aspergillus leporis]
MPIVRLEFRTSNFGLCETPEEWMSQYGTPSIFGRRPYLETCNFIVSRAINSGNTQAFKKYLQWGMNIRGYISEGHTVLSYALSAKNESVAWYLLREKMVQADDIDQQLGLYEYAESLAGMTVTEDMEWLLNDLMNLDPDRFIAALSAEAIVDSCSKFSVNTVVRLLESGLRLTAKHRWTGQTLLHAAAQRSDSEVLKWVLNKAHKEQASWFFEEDKYGWTALQCAFKSKASRDKNVGLLLEWVSIAKRNEIDFKGDHTLWLAAWYGHLPAVELLLDLGCDPNYVPKGCSNKPLHWAINYAREHLSEKEAFAKGCRIISLLVGHRAGQNIQNAWEQTAF